METSTQIRSKLTAAREQAEKSWTPFAEAREVLRADGFDASSDAGKKALNDASGLGDEYEKHNTAAKALEESYTAALRIEGLDAPKGNSPFGTDGARDGLLQEWDGKSAGQRVVASKEYKALVDSRALLVEGAGFNMLPAKALTRDEHIHMVKSGMTAMQMKTLATTFGAPGTSLLRADRQPGILPLLQAKLQLRNLISIGATDNNTVEWVRMTSITNNAAEVAEATATSGSSGTKPESGMAFTVENSVVKTIAHFMPSTRAALADMAQLATLIDNVLVDGVARRLNGQILSGDGTGANLTGILETVGIQAQDDVVQGVAGGLKIERILAAITKVRLAFHEPTAILMHPNDFEAVRLAKNDFGYLFGPPSQSGETRMWGLPVVEDVTVAEGQPIVGQWDEAILYVRDDVNILTTDSHSDWFVRNMIVVLAEGRYALAVPRPAAFCTVDFETPEA